MAVAPRRAPTLAEEGVTLDCLAAAGDVQGMRDVIKAVEDRQPAYWQTPIGRFYLRTATYRAIIAGRLNIVQYLCVERGEGPMAAGPEGFGTFPLHTLLLALSSIFTPCLVVLA